MKFLRGDSEKRDRVTLRGLYDERRSDELKAALIPVVRGEISTIDMSAVETIERVALASFVPLARKIEIEPHARAVRVIGMNDQVRSTFASTGLSKYFHDERRKEPE